ncbi:MAG: hypothetical protein MJZ57_00760 [Bacteroidales bacterium]|nr:hypothetical protein [Bacteroidales bacterium]
MDKNHFFVAIPAMDELQDLPLTLQDLSQQVCNFPFAVHICVNQPESYWQQSDKKHICENNRQLLEFLAHYTDVPLHVIDRSSPGNGWDDKKFGVGWARKTLFDNILSTADNTDIIVSLDADTRIPSEYLQTIADNFTQHPNIPAISVPYYHPLTDQDANNRAILRYEIYMRNYAINMYNIGSPYSFTAIGSAIAMRAGDLRKIGGITPVKSGEDFYLLQKFRKMSPISNYNDTLVYPAARFSDRVFFGTGPALIKGSRGEWNSYPIYPHQLFEPIAETYQLLAQLFEKDIHTDFLDFLQQQFNNTQLWQSIRQNVKDIPHFIKAFHEKADGLRILQYLRQRISNNTTDEQNLFENLQAWCPEKIPQSFTADTTFQQLSTEQLNELRDLLFDLEMKLRNRS